MALTARIPQDLARDITPDALFARIGAEIAGQEPRDLLVYIHIPFCSSKCHFCDFVADLDASALIGGADIRDRYVSALCRQIADYGPRVSELGFRVRLVYWGGGTPSRLSADELGRITRTLADSFDLSGVREHSFESSPETLTAEKVARLRENGATRVSMGVQSFMDWELRRAGRSHTPDQARAAVQAVRDGGIENFNLDLIAAMPGQSLDDLRYSIETCVELAPTHVTVYPYRPDERTVMSRQVGRGDRPGQEFAHMQESMDVSQRMLLDAGYIEYAIGHFARGEQYRFLGESHYFDLGGDFLGFGSGGGSMIAHHSLSNPHNTFRRFQEDPLPIASCSRFTVEDISTIAPALRLAMLAWHGIDRKRFEHLAGYPLSQLCDQRVFQDYLDYYRTCGGEFVEDAHGLRLSEATQRRTYLRSLMRQHRRATKSAVQIRRRPPAPVG